MFIKGDFFLAFLFYSGNLQDPDEPILEFSLGGCLFNCFSLKMYVVQQKHNRCPKFVLENLLPPPLLPPCV